MTPQDHKIATRPFHGRVRIMTAGYLIAASTDAIELAETGCYLEVDVTESTEAHGAPSDRFDRSRCRVFAFVGRPSFIRDEDVRRGVIDRRYLHCISEGVSQWEERFPGFQNEFERSTELDASVPIADLTRMDL